MALIPIWIAKALRALWLPLLLVILLLWLVNFIFQSGRAIGQGEVESIFTAQQLATEREHAARLAALSRALAEVEQRASDAATRTEQAEQTLRQEITRYAQRPRSAADTRPCLDDDGLRLWRAANAAGHPSTDGPATASVVAGELPATAATARRSSGEPAAKPRGRDDAVPALPGSPRRAGGVAEGVAP